MYGIDISNWQAGIDLSKGNYDFCICKATEGTWYADKQLKGFTAQLTELNKLIGVYHFARPDENKTVEKMQEEADFFVKTVKEHGLLGKAILCLDWETEPMMNLKLMRAWVARVYETTNISPFIYTSKSVLEQISRAPDHTWIYAYGVWIASWPSIKQFNVGEETHLALPTTPEWGWYIWQYSSNGRMDGYSGRIDLNYSTLTREEWIEHSQPFAEEISEDMKWAIDVGLFKGYPDGTIREYEPLTRGQLATVLRRLYNVNNN